MTQMMSGRIMPWSIQAPTSQQRRAWILDPLQASPLCHKLMATSYSSRVRQLGVQYAALYPLICSQP
jgi:hypothetical protein